MAGNTREYSYRHSGKSETDHQDYHMKGFFFHDKPTRAMRRVLEKALSFTEPEDNKRTIIEHNLTIFFRLQKYYDDFYDLPEFFHIVAQDLGWHHDVAVEINTRWRDARCAFLFRGVPATLSENEQRLAGLVDDLRRTKRHDAWAMTANRAAHIQAMRDNYRALYHQNHWLMLDYEPAMPFIDQADVDWMVPWQSRARSRSPQDTGRGQNRERSPLSTGRYVDTSVQTEIDGTQAGSTAAYNPHDAEGTTGEDKHAATMTPEHHDSMSNQALAPGLAIVQEAVQKIKALRGSSEEHEAYMDMAFRLEMLGDSAAELAELVKEERDEIGGAYTGPTETEQDVGPLTSIIQRVIDKMKELGDATDTEVHMHMMRRLEVMGHDAAELEREAAGEEDNNEDLEYEKFRAPSPN